MKITIYAIGKIKENYYVNAIKEYSKRLNRYCQLEFVEVADEKTPDGASPALERQIKQKEGERLLKYVREDVYFIALAIDGNMCDSLEFSRKLEQLGIQGRSHIGFAIGGSLGLSHEVLTRANETISFSKMTFPHQLMRVILLEQVYRGYRIMNGEPYHK